MAKLLTNYTLVLRKGTTITGNRIGIGLHPATNAYFFALQPLYSTINLLTKTSNLMKKANFQWAFSGGLRNALLTLGLVVFFCLGAATTASAQWVSSNEALELIDKKIGEINAEGFSPAITNEASAGLTSFQNRYIYVHYLEQLHGTIKNGSDVPAALQSTYNQFTGYMNGRDLAPLDYSYNQATQLLQQ